jgi:hypothetical protein
VFFLDADDVMLPDRINRQYEKAKEIERNGSLAFVGSSFVRLPKDATERYTRWACNLTDEELYTQVIQFVYISILTSTVSSFRYIQLLGLRLLLQHGLYRVQFTLKFLDSMKK